MKISRRQILFAVGVVVVTVAVVVLVPPGSSKRGEKVLTDAQLESPDAVIDIHVKDFKVVSPSSTKFRVKHGSVTKLRFFVEGEEILIHLTGKNVDINTESDETSALPGSIFVGGLDVGTYEIAAYDETGGEKHVLGKVEVVR